NTMLIEKIDGLDPEPLERGFGDLLYMLRPAVESYPTRLSVGLEFESELGGDHDLPTDGSQRLAHEFFVYEWAVNLRSIEESDSAFDGGSKKRAHLPFVFRWAVRSAHSHASEPEGRDFKAAISKFAFLHCFSSGNCL